MTVIAIIGAGISAGACVRALGAVARRVVVFEKSRGVGGRLSTRRTSPGGVVAYDHGAPYFLASHSDFQQKVQDWQKRGLVVEWPLRVAHHTPGQGWQVKEEMISRMVPVPHMSVIAKDLLCEVECLLQTRIVELSKHDSGWTLTSESGGIFSADIIISTIPQPQARELCSPHDVPNHMGLWETRMVPTWTIGFEADRELFQNFHQGHFHSSTLQTVLSNHHKPGRPPQPWRYVLYSTEDFARENLEIAHDQVKTQMLNELTHAIPQTSFDIQPRFVHRWRFAQSLGRGPRDFMYIDEMALGICGDWMVDGTVEGAYLSGFRLGEKIRTVIGEKPVG